MKRTDPMAIDWQELRTLAALFLRLGTTSFGGPVAHIAMMEDEVVVRRKWLDRQHFVDLIGATNLIPGPNSTEMAIHIGAIRAGWAGLMVAGACFILPATLIVLVLAWLYARYGALPQAQWLFYGIKPVVIAIVAQALWKFSRTALRDMFAIVIATATVLLVLLGADEVQIIALAATVGLVAGFLTRPKTPATVANSEVAAERPTSRRLPLLLLGGSTVAGGSAKLLQLFLIFLKIGSIIYGSGYVLLAFLREDFVVRLHWLTDHQLIDAIAIGQMTPGPVFTTATFVGYQIAGAAGAAVATVAIFLPSFLMVGLLSVFMDRLRQSPVARKFLNAVNATSLALMLVVTYQLAHDAISDMPTACIGLAALLLLLLTRINSAVVIAAGAVAGIVVRRY